MLAADNSCKANLITSLAHKNKLIAYMLVNARKDHSIPLIRDTIACGTVALRERKNQSLAVFCC